MISLLQTRLTGDREPLLKNLTALIDELTGQGLTGLARSGGKDLSSATVDRRIVYFFRFCFVLFVCFYIYFVFCFCFLYFYNPLYIQLFLNVKFSLKIMQSNCRAVKSNAAQLIQHISHVDYEILSLQSLHCQPGDLPRLEGYYYQPVNAKCRPSAE